MKSVKSILKKIIAVALVLVMMGAFVGEVIPTVAEAASLDYIERIKTDKSGESFIILEVVPDTTQGSIGYYIDGQEPTGSWLDDLAEISEQSDRKTYMNTYIKSYLDSNGLISSTADAAPLYLASGKDLYTEYYPWQTISDDEVCSLLNLNETAIVKIKGDIKKNAGKGAFSIDKENSTYTLKDNGGYNQNISYFLSEKDSAFVPQTYNYYYQVTFSDIIDFASLSDEELAALNGKAIYQIVYEGDEEIDLDAYESTIPEESETAPVADETAEEPTVEETADEIVVEDAVSADGELFLNGESEVADESIDAQPEENMQEPAPTEDAEETPEGEQTPAEEASEQSEGDAPENPGEESDPEPQEEIALEAEGEKTVDYYKYIGFYAEDGSIELDIEKDYVTLVGYDPKPYEAKNIPADQDKTTFLVAVSSRFTYISSESGTTSYFKRVNAYTYVGTGGDYDFTERSSSSNTYTFTYDYIQYSLNFSNNNWFMRNVFDYNYENGTFKDDSGNAIAAEDLMDIQVWSYDPALLAKRSGSILNADLIVLTEGVKAPSGLTVPSGLEELVDGIKAAGFDAANDISADCLDSIYNTVVLQSRNACPMVVDSDLLSNTAAVKINKLMNWLYNGYPDETDSSKIKYAPVYSYETKAGGVEQNVYFFNEKDFSGNYDGSAFNALANASFKSATVPGSSGSAQLADESPYRIVQEAINSVNTARLEKDASAKTMSTEVTQAACFRQIIDYAGQLLGNKKDRIRVLMIQPMQQGYIFKHGNTELGTEGNPITTEKDAADYIRTNYLPATVELNSYSTVKIEDIAISVETVSILEFVAHTDDLIANYDMIIIGASTNGLSVNAKETYGTTIYNNPIIYSSNAEKKAYLTDGMFYSEYGDVYEADVTPALEWSWGSGNSTRSSVYRASGNDLTPVRLAELKAFVDAGLPVIVDDKLLNSTEGSTQSMALKIEGVSADTSNYSVQAIIVDPSTGDRLDLTDYKVEYTWYYKNPQKSGSKITYPDKWTNDTDSSHYSDKGDVFTRSCTLQQDGNTFYGPKVYCTAKVTHKNDKNSYNDGSQTLASNTIQLVLNRTYQTQSCTFTYKREKHHTGKYWGFDVDYYSIKVSSSNPSNFDFSQVEYTFSYTEILSDLVQISAIPAPDKTYADMNDYLRDQASKLVVCTVSYKGQEITLSHRTNESTKTISASIPIDTPQFIKENSVQIGSSKTIYIPPMDPGVNKDRVHETSAMYSFLEYACGFGDANKVKHNVKTVATASTTDGKEATLTDLNKCSCPEMRVTKVGSEAYDSRTDSDKIITLNTAALEINFNLDNPTDPTPILTRYDFNLYIDKNGDGFFTDDELRDDAVINWGSVGDKELKAGETYTVYLALDSSDEGIIPWQLELIKEDVGGVSYKYVHATDYGYCYYKPSDIDTIKILQVCGDDECTTTVTYSKSPTSASTPDNQDVNTSTLSNLEKLEAERMFKSKYPTGAFYWPTISKHVTIKITENKTGAVRTVAKDYSGVLTATDSEVYSLIKAKTLTDPKTNTKTEKSNASYTEKTLIDANTIEWTYAGIPDRYAELTYTQESGTETVTSYFPKVSGTIGLHVDGTAAAQDNVDYNVTIDVLPTYALVQELAKDSDYLDNYNVLVLGFDEGYSDISSQSVAETIEAYAADNKNSVIVTHDYVSAIREISSSSGEHSRQYYATTDSFLTKIGLNSASTETRTSDTGYLNRYGIFGTIIDWFLPKSYVGETQGYTRHTIIRYMDNKETNQRNSDNTTGFIRFIQFLFNTSKTPVDTFEMPHASAATTTTVTELNKGRVTSYPYNLNRDLNISETFEPYYQLNLNLADTSVWYCLSGGTNQTSGQNDGYYDDAKNDAVNCYYVYSKNNVYYFGGGMSGKMTSDEAMLFINTLVGCYEAGKWNREHEADEMKSSVRFVNDEGTAPISSLLVASDSNNITVMTSSERMVDFKITKSSKLSSDQKYSVTFYNANESAFDSNTNSYPAIDSQYYVIREKSTGNSVSNGELLEGKVYTLVLCLGTESSAESTLLYQLLGSNNNYELGLDATPVGVADPSKYRSPMTVLTLQKYGLLNIC